MFRLLWRELGDFGPVMSFNREVSVGHLLTVASVLIALAGLLYSQRQDRAQARLAEQGMIREAGGFAVSELDRISNEMELFFLQVEPEYVTVSEALADHRSIAKARDELWRFITEKRADMEQAVARVSSFSGAQAIAQADPELFLDFQAGLRALGELRSETFMELVTATQREILSIGLESEVNSSAYLGNQLRGAHYPVLSNYRDEQGALIEPLRQRLETLLGVTGSSKHDDAMDRDGGFAAASSKN